MVDALTRQPLSKDELWRHAKVAMIHKCDCKECFCCLCLAEWRQLRRQGRDEVQQKARVTDGVERRDS